MTATSLDRRTFLKLAGLVAIAPYSPAWAKSQGILVNDLHSQLNATRVAKIVRPDSLLRLQEIVTHATKERNSISVCGGRHAGGGQQFGEDMLLVDTSNLNNVLDLDLDKGLIEVQSGIIWTQLLPYLEKAQLGKNLCWGINQKQTGADRLSIGGTLSANAHGQGLQLKPFVADVEAFTLVDGSGEIHRCSRTENAQ